MKPAFYLSVVSLIFLCSSVFTVQAAVLTSPRLNILPSAQAALASGDLNSDGFPDLIVGGDPITPLGPGKIYVFLGKGNGNLQSPQEYRIGFGSGDSFLSPYVQQIKIADMDNDGKLDVIVAHNQSRMSIGNRTANFVSVLFGNGDGTLRSAAEYRFADGFDSTYAQAIDIADIDGDGLKDVILIVDVSAGPLGQLWLLKNIGNEMFQNIGRLVFNGNIWDVKVAKVNRDRFFDFVMATDVGTIIGYGDGRNFPASFEQRDVGVLEGSVVAADFNRDGRTDFAVTPISTPQLRIFINTSFGVPSTPVIYQTPAPMLLRGYVDIDRDGASDLIGLEGFGRIQIFYGNGVGAFSGPEDIQTNLLISDLSFADFDNNGKLDIGLSILDQSNPTSPKAGVMLNAPNTSRYHTDFDGDARSDFTVFRPSSQQWWSLLSSGNSHIVRQFGLPTDRMVVGNYDGDNKADIAVYRDGVWYILQSSDGSVKIDFWGTREDIPVPADYYNDGSMNLAVFRPSTGVWWIKKENGFDAIPWGLNLDKPVPADYDGDGKTDIAVFRPMNGVWYILPSKTGNPLFIPFGVAEDKPVPADYDGDGLADIAVFRPSNGVWYVLQSSNRLVRSQSFGLPNDIPTPNDFDGDGKNDIAVCRPSESNWYVLLSSTGLVNVTTWGITEDLPVRVTQ